ncbi:MAG: hypothetical protein R3350_05060, partial [Saprospiraceae bacterium]|nr:hypothetical protein [Saprospiraceae bacterium]
VLAEGTWFKIETTETGVYRIDRDVISSLGLNPDAVDPDHLRIYGNGGRPLPGKDLLNTFGRSFLHCAPAVKYFA